MPRPTLSQKISLLLMGCFLALAFLELGLRLGGWLFTARQERHNRATFQADEIRILCIGESTTALGGDNSYPSQLEQILNARMPGKRFKVINKGLVSKTSADILSQLRQDMERYRPAIVVSMLGINDSLKDIGDPPLLLKVKSFLRHFRSYDFFELAAGHIRQKLRESRAARGVLSQSAAETAGEAAPVPAAGPEAEGAPDDRNPGEVEIMLYGLAASGQVINRLTAQFNAAQQPGARQAIQEKVRQIRAWQAWRFLRLGLYYKIRQDYKRAEEFLKMAISTDPTNYGSYVELGRCYKEKGDCKSAVGLFQQALKLYPESSIAKMELGFCYDQLKLDHRAKEVYDAAAEGVSGVIHREADIGDWLLQHNYFDKAEAVFKEAVEKNPRDYFLYEKLAYTYGRQGRTEEAAAYSRKAKDVRDEAERYLPATILNYNEIAEVVGAAGSRLICMQYPLRGIGPLKEIFWTDSPLVFVENKTNFERAWGQGKYNDYFSDSFAGYFGHCTGRGNRMIAENLAETILASFFN